jgi:hypothetical protein
MRIRFTLLLISVISLLIPARAVAAAVSADVKDDRITFDFPNTATFSASLSSTSKITSIVLEYGNVQQTCGEVVAKAFPKFTSSNTVKAEWIWDMRQSGSLPPGATIWWRWHYKDEAGSEFVSDKQSAIWLDGKHDWQSISNGNLQVHYYGKDQAFAQTMLEAGLEGLRRNKDQAGLVNDGMMNIYIYPNYSAMQAAVLYEPSWTGGQAYSDFNIVIMGLSNYDQTWDKNTVIHELTHLLVGHFTFSCLGTLPGWIEEGVAMFSEGKLDPKMQSKLEQAVQNDNLITLRSLNGGFSELPDKANLSYGQSYSVISFLITTYGQEEMTRLLIALRDAKPIDTALQEVYGFDTDGLDNAWRQSIGAAPRPVSAQATSRPTPTYIPTYIPVSGAPLAATPTPEIIPTSSSQNNSGTPGGPPLSLTIALACFCGLLLLIFGVFILGLIVRRGNMKGGQNG